MNIPLAWESYSFPQPLGESVRAVNEKVSALKKLGGGGGLGGQ